MQDSQTVQWYTVYSTAWIYHSCSSKTVLLDFPQNLMLLQFTQR